MPISKQIHHVIYLELIMVTEANPKEMRSMYELVSKQFVFTTSCSLTDIIPISAGILYLPILETHVRTGLDGDVVC